MWLDLAASFRVLEVQPPDDEGENRRDESDDQQRVDVVINVVWTQFARDPSAVRGCGFGSIE
jgi:hypothetical protein